MVKPTLPFPFLQRNALLTNRAPAALLNLNYAKEIFFAVGSRPLSPLIISLQCG